MEKLKPEESSSDPDVLVAKPEHHSYPEHLLNNECFSDLTLVIGGRVFHAHRAILDARMPKLAAMFEPELPKQTLTLDDEVEPDAFFELLRFVYVGRIHDFKKRVTAVTKAARVFGMMDVQKLCVLEMLKLAQETMTLDSILNQPELMAQAGEAAVARLVERAGDSQRLEAHVIFEFFEAAGENLARQERTSRDPNNEP